FCFLLSAVCRLPSAVYLLLSLLRNLRNLRIRLSPSLLNLDCDFAHERRRQMSQLRPSDRGRAQQSPACFEPTQNIVGEHGVLRSLARAWIQKSPGVLRHLLNRQCLVVVALDQLESKIYRNARITNNRGLHRRTWPKD